MPANRPRAVIVDVVRTPSGRADSSGVFATIGAAELLATALLGVTDRAGILSTTIDDVIAGCVMQVGDQASNIARTASLAAGFNESVPGITINRHTASGLQALQFAAQGVETGTYAAVVACGVESMSHLSGRPSHDASAVSRALRHRYPERLVTHGVAAELVCARLGIGRRELDEYAARSHARAARATDANYFANEIVPVDVVQPTGRMTSYRVDETIRRGLDVRRLPDMKPAFFSAEDAHRFPEITWSVTLGNSAQRADGAAAALVMSSDRATALGLTPRAAIRASAIVGGDAMLMMTGVGPATKLALDRASLVMSDIDAVEIDETFAAIPLAWNREFEFDEDRLNARGGAISLGNPLGAVGVGMLATILGRLGDSDGRFGLQVMAAAGGMAHAMVIERLS